MNTTINNWSPALQTPQKETLPPLIKGSSTYKMIVPRKVEEKIRYLCRKFPTLEWSGVLFTTYEGNFEDNNLVITCQDIYPMDLGSPGFTQFRMDETVASYIADNLELFNADVQLVHSHNQMQCWFSGTDTNTLREEGNDRNCFVSLIVNNAGTYCAAITRKVHRKTEVVRRNLGWSYEFFGQGPVSSNLYDEDSKEIDETVIEYFMLDVEVEKVDNPLEYLDTRFNEIEAKKKAEKPVITTGYSRVYDSKKYDTALVPSIGNDYDEDKEFLDWIHSDRKESAEAKEAVLFDKETMNGMVDPDMWYPDPTIIHHLVVQLITCSLIVSPDIDLKQWIVRHMMKKYNEIFGTSEDPENFGSWAEATVEFLVNHYDCSDVPDALFDDYDEYISRVAMAIIDELDEYQENSYIKRYKDILERFIV